MSILSLILVIAVVGLVVYLVTLIPMAPIFRNVIYAVTALFLILWILQSMGLVGSLPTLRVR